MEELLNLDNLSQEEKNKILNVLQKDEMVRQAEDKKIGQLKAEIQAIRMKSVLRAGDDLSKMCARCHAELGRFFNRGDLCPKCRFRVCNVCKENLFQGTWLCVLCYKQRQLKFFTGDYSSGQLSRWPSGADLVKASIHKMAVFKGASSDSEILDSPRKEVKNGRAVSNGSVQSDIRDKKEKVEFPQESDQRKLNQLFDAFRVSKPKELSSKSHTTVRRVTSQKYEDSDTDSESQSTDTEKNEEEFPRAPLSGNVDSVDHGSSGPSVTVSNGALNGSRSGVVSEKKLQRNFSDDSDQTLLSDDAPFSKSSTETQIKVDVHSDGSSSSTLSVNKKEAEKENPEEEVVKMKSPGGKMKQTATELIMAMKMNSPSKPSQPNNSKLGDPRRYQPGRSPSPYSFDSIPSSHANSPLPVKRHDSHLSRESSDTDSTSRMSNPDFSGTESSQVRESSSGAEDYVVEEISKIRFRRMSKKVVEKGKPPRSPPPPECDLSGVGMVRGEQWGFTSPTDHPHKPPPHPSPPTKSSPLPPANSITPNTPEHQQFISLSDASHCEVPSNVSSDLSLEDIERDCALDSDVYDITDLAEVSKSLLTLPREESSAMSRKKSPRMKRKLKQKSDNVDRKEHSVTKIEAECVESPTQHSIKMSTNEEKIPHFQPVEQKTTPSKKKDCRNSKTDSITRETKSTSEVDGSSASKKLIVFNPEDLESDSSGSSQEFDLPAGRKRIIPEKETSPELEVAEEFMEEKSGTMPHSSEESSGKSADVEVEEMDDEKLNLDDSGKHDSFDSLLESSLFQTHRLSSIDDRKNRFESVESFNLSPLTPLSGSKIKTKAQAYTFAFVNDSVWTNESSDCGQTTNEDEFDEIFNKAVEDLETNEKNPKPTLQRRKKSHRPSQDSYKELGEISESKEELLEENKLEGNHRSFLMEFGDHHEFRFSTNDACVDNQARDVKIDSIAQGVSNLKESEKPSSLWRFEDDSVKEGFHQVFGTQEPAQKQTYAQNRALLRKTFATSNESMSTESDALSVIHEEVDSSDQSNEDMEDGRELHLDDIQEEDDSSLLTEGTVELCVEKNVQDILLHKPGQVGSEIKMVDDSEGIDENITVVELDSQRNSEDENNKILLDPCLEEHSSTDHIEGNLGVMLESGVEKKHADLLEKESQKEDLNHKQFSRRNVSEEPDIQSKETKEAVNNTESSLSKMLLASSQIALVTLGTSESPADKSIQSTEQLVSSLDADVCLDEEGSQASEDLLLQQIIQSQCHSEDLSMEDSSPESQTERVRKRNKSKRLVQEWLQTDVEGEVVEDVPDDLPRPLLVQDWLDRKIQEGVDPAPVPAPLSLPLSEGGQNSADSYSSTAPNVPILQLEEHSERPEGGTTRLSPRASSEGSGSFEDSGHVSGASTENTPEHRRTDSAVSQLSVPSSTLSTVTDRSSEDTDIDDLVASHRSISVSSRGNLLSTIADSRESILSFYSNAGEVDYGKIPVSGEICFGLEYNYRTGTLEIQIKQCKGLAPADPKRNRSDPYVKTYLLPDKTRGGKRKTRIIKNTLNPVFEQTLRYLISKSELENRTLWVTVWHNDRFGRNDFLGEVTINFDYFRFGDSSAKWYPLQERIEPQPAANLTYKGDLFLSIKYVPPEKVTKEDVVTSPSKKRVRKGRSEVGGPKGQLHVLIKEARNLTAVRSSGFSDPFVKGYLLPDKQRGLKQKTGVVKRNCNPQWNHTFVFEDVSKSDLKERCLELTVWDHDKLSSNEFLGGLRLNLGVGQSYGRVVDWMDAHGEEISLWQAMLDRPNIWIDGALMLRPNMDKRKY